MAAFLAAPLRAELRPENLVLVINDRVPASRELAEHYAQQRHVPPARIIALEIPDRDPQHPADDISFADYQSKIATPIRKYLQQSKLQDQVACLVLFWGLPLRVGPRVNTAAEITELAAVEIDLAKVRQQTEAVVKDTETIARAANPTKPLPVVAPSGELGELLARSDNAVWIAAAGVLAMPAGKERNELSQRLVADYRALSGPVVAAERLSTPPLSSLTSPAITSAELDAAHQRQKLIRDQEAKVDPSTTEGRTELRRIAKDDFGLLINLKVLLEQTLALKTEESQAALGSELACLWWPAYPRYRWQQNPLFWKRKTPSPFRPLMVCRLDGPDVLSVRRIIDVGLEVEAKGLNGRVVIDARGKPPTEPYGQYDQTLRNLAALLKAKTPLDVLLDDREQLLPPHSAGDVAIYCGWYSLHHYVPCCRFVPGAVGFHVASAEMVSLHQNDSGWAHGLIQDGVVATLGPVAEPYLQSFPAADEFFPLLLTGKLTLAEVYWKTTPLVSWMQEMVGDPLYCPYAAHPGLNVADLPVELRQAVIQADGSQGR